MRYRQGDIVLIPFPYTDLSGTKQRPAVILSKETDSGQNLIVAKITSVIRADKFSFAIRPTDIDRTLKYESEVRTNELFTISHTIIIKRFATFKRGALKKLTERIQAHISTE